MKYQHIKSYNSLAYRVEQIFYIGLTHPTLILFIQESAFHREESFSYTLSPFGALIDTLSILKYTLFIFDVQLPFPKLIV